MAPKAKKPDYPKNEYLSSSVSRIITAYGWDHCRAHYNSQVEYLTYKGSPDSHVLIRNIQSNIRAIPYNFAMKEGMENPLDYIYNPPVKIGEKTAVDLYFYFKAVYDSKNPEASSSTNVSNLTQTTEIKSKQSNPEQKEIVSKMISNIISKVISNFEKNEIVENNSPLLEEKMFQAHHEKIDIFNIRIEPSVELIEEVDERGLKFIKSLVKNDAAIESTIQELRKKGEPNPEDFVESMKHFQRAKVSSVSKYSVSEKCKEFTSDNNLLPGRLWANNYQTLQSAKRQLRAILIGNKTIDFDQSSCWMRTLLFLCRELEKKEWDSPNGKITMKFTTLWLEDWIKNKKVFMTQWIQQKNKQSEKSIKNKLSIMANWGGVFKTGFEPFQGLHKEIKTIESQIQKVPEFKYWVDFSQNKMRQSKKCETIIGMLTKAIETNITWACVREVQARNIKVCVVVHDGMNVYKDGIGDLDICSVFDQVSDFIAPNAAKWAKKDPDFAIYDINDLPTGHQLVLPENWKDEVISMKPNGPKKEDDEIPKCPCGCKCTQKELEEMGLEFVPFYKVYSFMKDEFEKNHCQVHSNFIDEEKKFPEPIITSQAEMVTKCKGRLKYYIHKKPEHGDKLYLAKVNFFPEWMDDEYKRFYRDYDVYPNVSKCPHDVYNLWQGYAVFRKVRNMKISDFTEDVIKGCAFFVRHVHRLIDDNFREFEGQYWSHTLKYPEIKIGILLGLLGQKRIGKGQRIDMIMNIIGMRYYCMTSHPARDVWGQNGTDYCDGKIVCRLAEPKASEFTSDAGAMRVWITDNPVERKAMHKRAETIHNYTRFVVDANDPVLPDEQNGGRIAQTLCSSYWKEKWIDDPQEFVTYNTSLGQYIADEKVQVLYAYLLLRLDCPQRFSFHTINEVTGNFAKEERKRNRTLCEKFLIHLCENTPWNVKEIDLTEQDKYPYDSRESLAEYEERRDKNTILYHLESFNRMQSFKEPLRPRSMTTAIGNWISMKHGGIRKERPWDEKNQQPGPHHFIIDLQYLRSKFSLDAEREQGIKDYKSRNPKKSIVSFTEKCEECNGCTCGLCHLKDDELLDYYVDFIRDEVEDSRFEEWVENPDQFPPTFGDDQKTGMAMRIQKYARGKIVRQNSGKYEQRKKEREEELIKIAEERELQRQEQEEWNRMEQKRRQREQEEREEKQRLLKKYPPDPQSECKALRMGGHVQSCLGMKLMQVCNCDMISSME